MKKYNLSKIMKRAWELVKKVGETLSSGLKKAWKEAKSTGSVKMCVVGREEFTVNTATGVISGKTFHAKEFLKRNFNAKWNAAEKQWTVDPEAFAKELETCAGYYEKYIVSDSRIEEIKKVVKTIVSEELVNHWDGFYKHVVYSDGTKERIFIG